MKEQLDAIKLFVEPYYADKDIMHDITHIERIEFVLNDLLSSTKLAFNRSVTYTALYLHGIIYSHEEEIKVFLRKIGIKKTNLELITRVAWESQKESKPSTNEGLLLHDAHMLEGGRNFEIIKSLITGSVRGQTLEETMVYIENHVLEKGACYTAEGKKRYKTMKERTRQIYRELNLGLGRKETSKKYHQS